VIEVAGDKIQTVREDRSVTEESYLCPGFVDAHVHIESSMLTPPEFARIAVIHGTTATVSDPHEIANVLGLEGVRYMQRLAAQTPVKIHFGIPSCVPATNFETAGAIMGPAAIEELCADPSLLYLSEMMNFPGVIHRDPMVMEKIAIARKHGKHIDGHAPGLRGEDLKKYVAAGIETATTLFAAPGDRQLPLLDPPREGEEIVASYYATGVNLGRHPLALLRLHLQRGRWRSAARIAVVLPAPSGPVTTCT
jgi:adenine deaminase